MSDIAKLPNLDVIAERVLRSLGASGPCVVWVNGATGSGRGSLLRRLKTEVPGGAAVLDLAAPYEPDAVGNALLQLEAAARAVAGGLPSTSRSVAERTSALARGLATAGRTVLVQVAFSWEQSHREDGPAFRAARGAELLRSLLMTEGLRAVLLTSEGFPGGQFLPAIRSAPLQLARPEADLVSLDDEARWGAYAVHARELKRAVGSLPAPPHPLSLRFAVGASRIAGAKVAADLLRRSTPGSLLRFGVLKALPSELRAVVKRLAAVRRPVRSEELLRAVGVPQDESPLVTQCLGYDCGPGLTRLSEVTRALLLREFEAEPPGDAGLHLRLADAHASLDGRPRFADATEDGAVHWLEKAHHLAHGGPEGAARWEALGIEEVDLLVDRAYALSVEERRYEAAAAVYERCVELDPDHAYAWHYLGFNLRACGLDAKRTEEALRRAVALDPTNPWWNSRLTTFLIDQSSFLQAEQTWAEAQARVDPDGVRVQQDRMLARNLHRWVAEAWLRSGEPHRAQAVLDGVPEEVLQNEVALRRLADAVNDAVEAIDQCGAVYPPGVPEGDRWRRPLLLRERDGDGRALLEWYPARVVEATSEAVTVRLAEADEEPSRRRFYRKEIAAKDWPSALGRPADAQDLFLEIGLYGADAADPAPVTVILARPRDQSRLYQPEAEVDPNAFAKRLWG